LVREGPRHGWAAEPDNLDTLLAAAVAEAPVTPARIAVRSTPDATPPALRPHYEADDGQQVTTGPAPTPPSALALLAAGWSRSDSIDLLQGPYGRGEDFGHTWKRWRVAAGLALLLVAAELGSMLHEN